MRRAAMFLLLASTLLSAGCGDRSLILTVTSELLDPSDVSQATPCPAACRDRHGPASEA
jgi:hypothetical protein